MDESSRVSMDETFVFLRKGSKRRPSHIATNTVDREDILCSIPKPSYRFLLILSLVQLLIIIAGSIAFGILGHLTCRHFVSTETEKCETTRSSSVMFDNPANNSVDGRSSFQFQRMLSTPSKAQNKIKISDMSSSSDSKRMQHMKGRELNCRF